MKSCKTCRFLVTDSFISPCAICDPHYSHWIENTWNIKPRIKKIDYDTLNEMINQVVQEFVKPEDHEEAKKRIGYIVETVVDETSK